MKPLKTPPENPKSPFTVNLADTDGPTPEELETRAKEMLAQAEKARAEAEQSRQAKLERDKSADLETLENLRREVSKLEFVAQGTSDPTKREEIYVKLIKYRFGIQEIEEKYGFNVPEIPEQSVIKPPNSSAVLVTALKIAVLIVACWGIVLYSGDFIVSKYPNAAIYNEVSFQKVLFGFSVFIGGFVSVIIALNVFFPGFGKYFNPFNHSALDFFDDFKQLNSWQRNLIALGLFFCLLFAFVLIAGGKLD